MPPSIHGIYNVLAFHSFNYKVRCQQQRIARALFHRYKDKWAINSDISEAPIPMPIRIRLSRPMGILYRGCKMLPYIFLEEEGVLSESSYWAAPWGPDCRDQPIAEAFWKPTRPPHLSGSSWSFWIAQWLAVRRQWKLWERPNIRGTIETSIRQDDHAQRCPSLSCVEAAVRVESQRSLARKHLSQRRGQCKAHWLRPCGPSLKKYDTEEREINVHGPWDFSGGNVLSGRSRCLGPGCMPLPHHVWPATTKEREWTVVANISGAGPGLSNEGPIIAAQFDGVHANRQAFRTNTSRANFEPSLVSLSGQTKLENNILAKTIHP